MNLIKKFFNKLAPTWDNSNNDISNIEDIITSLGIKEGDKILDIGCGTGIITSILSIKCKRKVLGIDISNKMIEIANSKNKNEFVNFKCIDFYKYRGSDYDYIVCFNAYPHFVKQKLFIKKTYELLNDKGKLAIIFDNDSSTTNSFHNNINSKISRNILSPKEEAKIFDNYFIPILTVEEKKKYILLLSKK